MWCIPIESYPSANSLKDDKNDTRILEADSNLSNEIIKRNGEESNSIFQISKTSMISALNRVIFKTEFFDERTTKRDFIGKKSITRNSQKSPVLSNTSDDFEKTKTFSEPTVMSNQENSLNIKMQNVSGGLNNNFNASQEKVRLGESDNRITSSLDNIKKKTFLKTSKKRSKQLLPKADEGENKSVSPQKTKNKILSKTFNELHKSIPSFQAQLPSNQSESNCTRYSYLSESVFEENFLEKDQRRKNLINFIKTKARNCKRNKKYLNDFLRTIKIVAHLNNHQPNQSKRKIQQSQSQLISSKSYIFNSICDKLEIQERNMSEEEKRTLRSEFRKKLILEEDEVKNYECIFPDCYEILSNMSDWEKHYICHSNFQNANGCIS